MNIKVIAISFVAGVLGVTVTLMGWHLYVDHQNLHALVNMVQQQAAQAKGAK